MEHQSTMRLISSRLNHWSERMEHQSTMRLSSRCALYIFTSKCASRHNSVVTACTFSTSQLPNWTEHQVCWHFLLPKVLPVTTACNIWFLICPDVSTPAEQIEHQSTMRLISSRLNHQSNGTSEHNAAHQFTAESSEHMEHQSTMRLISSQLNYQSTSEAKS